MTEITVLAGAAATVEGRWVNGQPRIPASALPAALGWELKAEGLCRDDICVLTPDRSAIEFDGMVDVVAVAALLDRPALVDADAELVAIGVARADRSAGLRDKQAPDFSFPDLNGVHHKLSSWAGKKRLLVAFSTW